METEICDFTCEVIGSVCSNNDEGEFVSYGIRAVASNGRIIYEFADILPDKTKVERFASTLNKEKTPLTHLHFAIMEFLQAM